MRAPTAALILFAALASSLAFPTNAIARQAHYIVLLDLSRSNPLVDNPEYARRVAADVAREMTALNLADFITVGTLGEYDVRKNFLLEKQLNIYFRPPAARRSLVQLIATIPEAVRSGKIQQQGQTNIIAALESMASRAVCTERKTMVIVVSDARENSSYGRLPPSKTDAIYSGCHRLAFVGLIGDNPKHANKLEKAWRKWSDAAGFQSFKAIRY